MKIHRMEAEVEAQGRLLLEDVPFPRGQPVEIIIIEKSRKRPAVEQVQQELAGSVVRYDAPTEPVGLEDWETLR